MVITKRQRAKRLFVVNEEKGKGEEEATRQIRKSVFVVGAARRRRRTREKVTRKGSLLGSVYRRKQDSGDYVFHFSTWQASVRSRSLIAVGGSLPVIFFAATASVADSSVLLTMAMKLISLSIHPQMLQWMPQSQLTSNKNSILAHPIHLN